MFSVLTSKIFGGLAFGLALVLVVSTINFKMQIRTLNKQVEQKDGIIERQKIDISTLKNNVKALDLGLNTCNAGVASTAATAERINKAGVAALAQVQKAGAAVDRKVKQIDAMPAATCEDADAILRAGGL